MSLSALFTYDRNTPCDTRIVHTHTNDGITSQNITYLTPAGIRRAAYLVKPEGVGPFATILYVHWYEPQSPISHRSQFLPEATQMAQYGAVSLLIETMWSDRDWFIKRTQSDDFQNSVQQTIELRQALDILCAQPSADPSRIAFVGHDFGAMYGVLLGYLDPRPTCYVFMAGTPRFADWYLYYPSLTEAQKNTFIQEMAPLDPIERVSAIAPAPLLFQFAREDYHIPQERARAFYEAAQEPKELKWYDADHGLNNEATQDRIQWLIEKLDLNHR